MSSRCLIVIVVHDIKNTYFMLYGGGKERSRHGDGEVFNERVIRRLEVCHIVGGTQFNLFPLRSLRDELSLMLDEPQRISTYIEDRCCFQDRLDGCFKP